MKAKKVVYVAKTRKGRTTIWAGTIEELRTNVFGYTLECGNSWNRKISREPKTVASLVSNLNKSVSETQGACYEQDYYEVATKEQYDVQEAAKAPKQEVESSKVNKEQEVKQSNKSKSMAKKVNKTVKVEDSKNVNSSVNPIWLDREATDKVLDESGKKLMNNFDASVMDERILKLNEFKAVKMANLSKGKRPAAKEAKELATYILNNWDDEDALASICLDDASPIDKEVFNEIILSRLKNFDDAKKACEEAVKAEKAPKAKAEKKETKKAAPAKAKKVDSKKAEPKAKEEKQPKEKEAKTARKVGDVHPTHPTWIWTEYAAGKFDWRTNPADKKQGQRTDKATTSAKKSTNKKEASKKVAKTEPKKEEPKELTIEDFIAMPKQARGGKPSKAQQDALKLITKGYWIWQNGNTYWFKNAEGDTKQCNMDSVVAMFKRYGMEYIPSGLVK